MGTASSPLLVRTEPANCQANRCGAGGGFESHRELFAHGLVPFDRGDERVPVRVGREVGEDAPNHLRGGSDLDLRLNFGHRLPFRYRYLGRSGQE